MVDLILRKMNMIVNGEEYAPITLAGEHPPCFESRRQYEDWLESVDPDVGSPVPPRKDWPHEPNYCRDCSRAYRNEMRMEGRCLFPDTKFVVVGEGEDQEVVGV